MSEPVNMKVIAAIINSAADVVDGAIDLIDPHLEQYAAERIEFGRQSGRTQEMDDKHDIDTGYRALMDACSRLRNLADEPDDHVGRIVRAAWEEEARAS